MDIRVTFPGGERVDAELVGTGLADKGLVDKGFVVSTDHSREEGGEGSAPAPWQLFLASIATCAGAYVLSFCRQRDLPTDGVELVQHQEYDETGKRLASVSIVITVPREFPSKYRRALVRAAELCAVKKAISDPPEFEVTTRTGP